METIKFKKKQIFNFIIMNRLTQLFFLVAFLFTIASKAQLTAAYYDGSPHSKIGIGYEFSEKIWTELRFYNGFKVSDAEFEGVVNFSLKKDEIYNLYVGAGFSVPNFNALIVPVGVYIYPFEKTPNFSFVIEAQPMYSFDESSILFFGSWGIRYRFQKKS